MDLKKIAKLIEKELPGLGFALVVFEFGKTEKGGNYVSNAERPDMIQALFETAYRLKNNEDKRS